MVYAGISCNQSGLGIIINNVASNSDEVIISEDDVLQFPALQNNDFFYAYLKNCGKCEHIKVLAKNGNIFKIERGLNKECFPMGSVIEYDNRSVEAIRAMAETENYKFVFPLLCNQETKTVSIDETRLREIIRTIATDVLGI